MGKWTALRSTLPALPAEATYGDALMAECEVLRGKTIDTLTDTYNAFTEEKAGLTQELARVNLKLAAYERVLDETLEQENLESVKANGHTWTRSPEPYPKVEDAAALRAWAQRTMPDALALHSGTLKSVVKAALETGDVLPDGVTAYMKNGISRRRS